MKEMISTIYGEWGEEREVGDEYGESLNDEIWQS